MSDLGFDPLDQEFLSADNIRQETMQALAQLELDKHRLRLALVLHDGNGTAKTQNGSTIYEELDAVDAASEKIKSAFGHILYPNAETETQDDN